MRPTFLLFAAALLIPTTASVADIPPRPAPDVLPFELPLSWPEEQRRFVQDGPGLLLDEAELRELADRDATGRDAYITEFLTDPVPETGLHELVEAIERRRRLALSEIGTLLDDRARLLFLHGAPASRDLIDCAETYRPLEIWNYPEADGSARELVLYQAQRELPWRLWVPIDGKGVLYVEEMEYWLEQWEELKSRITGGRRFDREICDESKRIDEVTGVDGLYGFRKDRPKNEDLGRLLEPPADLAAWAIEAAKTPLPESDPLPVTEILLHYPDRSGQRMISRITAVLPAEAELVPFVEGESRQLRLRVEGRLEHRGRLFDEFRVRFQIPAAVEDQDDVPVALILDRLLRPDRDYLLRLRIVEETTDREVRLARALRIPRTPTPSDEMPTVPEEAIVALGEELKQRRIEGYDSLILVPPEADVVFGLWRAEALVTGDRIRRVTFFLDGKEVMSRRRPPFTAELRLDAYPREQVVRVEGADESGQPVAADEVVLNQPRGELRVRILEPERGNAVAGPVSASAEVVVPEEKSVESVEFLVNDELQETLERPPWTSDVEVPVGQDLVYLTVVAELDDGQRAEDVRFLVAPDYIEEVDVDLIELYTTVVDRSGRLIRGLEKSDFNVREDGQVQEIVKFELVEDLPLTIGITLDTSGSMIESLGQAKRTATDFLSSMITPRDRCFALAFADRPALVMGRTSDVGAVAEQLGQLAATGSTALHDAVVTSLYYFRGVRGRRALVLLSDGEDTSSSLEFEEALEYARRSGVAIYSIGLRIGITQVGVRRKLEKLATETGGRTFYISEAAELQGVYGEIEDELRSQYLLAYSPPSGGEEGVFHEIEVDVDAGGAKARTIKGYYD